MGSVCTIHMMIAGNPSVNVVEVVDFFNRDTENKPFPWCNTLYSVSFDSPDNNVTYWTQNEDCGCTLCEQLSQGQYFNSPHLIQTEDNVQHNLQDDASGIECPCVDCYTCEWLRFRFHYLYFPECDCEHCEEKRGVNSAEVPPTQLARP